MARQLQRRIAGYQPSFRVEGNALELHLLAKVGENIDGETPKGKSSPEGTPLGRFNAATLDAALGNQIRRDLEDAFSSYGSLYPIRDIASEKNNSYVHHFRMSTRASSLMAISL